MGGDENKDGEHYICDSLIAKIFFCSAIFIQIKHTHTHTHTYIYIYIYIYIEREREGR